jgi:hypothetical protein
MATLQAIAHRTTTDPSQHPHNQPSHPPTRTFIPSLIQGAQALPYTPWTNLPKPPPHGWWAGRQACTCPPCYFYTLTTNLNNGTFPLSVAVPLAQLINVGLLRLNFRHAGHNNTFNAEDKDYALSLYRDICYGVNSDQLPLQLLEILLVASKKAVLKPLDVGEPEYNHKEFEMCLKRAIARCKEEQRNSQGDGDDEEQTKEGAHQDDDEDAGALFSDEAEQEEVEDEISDKETWVYLFLVLQSQFTDLLTALSCGLRLSPNDSVHESHLCYSRSNRKGNKEWMEQKSKQALGKQARKILTSNRSNIA